MTAVVPGAGRNTIGTVAIVLACVLAVVNGVTLFAPRIAYSAGLAVPLISLVLSIVTLVLLLATVACALLGLRHPRKALAAIALGYAVVGLFSFGLWSIVFPLSQLLPG